MEIPLGTQRFGASVRHRGRRLRRCGVGQHARAGDVGAERLRRPRLCEYRLCLARQFQERSALCARCREPCGFLPAHVRHPGIVGRQGHLPFDRFRHVERLCLGQRTFRRLQRGQQAGRAVRHHEVREAGRKPHRPADVPLVGRHLPRRPGLLALRGHCPRRGADCPRQGAPRRRAYHARAGFGI